MPETQGLASSGSWVSRGFRHKEQGRAWSPETRSVQAKYFDGSRPSFLMGHLGAFKEEVAFEVGLQSE